MVCQVGVALRPVVCTSGMSWLCCRGWFGWVDRSCRWTPGGIAGGCLPRRSVRRVRRRRLYSSLRPRWLRRRRWRAQRLPHLDERPTARIGVRPFAPGRMWGFAIAVVPWRCSRPGGVARVDGGWGRFALSRGLGGGRTGGDWTVGGYAVVVRAVREHAAAIAWALRWASAMIVIMGLVPVAVGNALASPIQTPATSWSWPQGSATVVRGSRPIRQVPIWWAENSFQPPARSGIRWAGAMKASRSSPRRHAGASWSAAARIWLAPAAACRCVCASIARWALRRSSRSVRA